MYLVTPLNIRTSLFWCKNTRMTL